MSSTVQTPLTREQKIAVYASRGQAVKDALVAAQADQCPDHALIARLKRELKEGRPRASQFFERGDKVILASSTGGLERTGIVEFWKWMAPHGFAYVINCPGQEPWGVTIRIMDISGFESLSVFFPDA